MRRYCEKHDAYFDSETGIWLESQCSDEKCCYCAKRRIKHYPHKCKDHGGKEFMCG